jgi:capsular polysaccharide biosynthesis protein
VSMIVCYSPYAIDFLRKNFLRFADNASETPKRFFLRRTGTVRNITNESEVLDFFAARGWAIVDAAELSLAQQIQYFSQAEAICGIHGAGLTNCVWCKPGCKVIELLAENYLNGCFEWICGAVKAEHSYKVFPADSVLSANVNLKELSRLLASAEL